MNGLFVNLRGSLSETNALSQSFSAKAEHRAEDGRLLKVWPVAGAVNLASLYGACIPAGTVKQGAAQALPRKASR